MPETSAGVYVVALSPSVDAVEGTYPDAPISNVAIDELRAVCPALMLDGTPDPARAKLAKRIGSYWLPDETVLYVGLTGQPLRTRVRQYYKTPLGAVKPHKGGWWLKTLSVLADLHVYFAATADFKDAEENMLRTFAANVSDDSRDRLPPTSRLCRSPICATAIGGGATMASPARRLAPRRSQRRRHPRSQCLKRGRGRGRRLAVGR